MKIYQSLKIISLTIFSFGLCLILNGQVLQPKYEFRGVWVATVNNIDWPSKPGLSPELMQKEAVDLLEMHRENGINAVILQVRPCSDAFYSSSIEPWSRYLTGYPGRYPSPFWDPLHFWISECHKRNMELHAWLNPFRLAQNALEPLAGNHQAFTTPEWVVQYDNKLFFDPGIPATRAYITSVVCDIVRRYDVDGIHLDDYFYPYPAYGPFPDESSFKKYNRAFSPCDKDSWRRENVDILIKMMNDSIKSIKPWVKFGISPFGVWRNKKDDPEGSLTQAGITTYDHLYADVRKWLREGWIDYAAPQIYWETGHQQADFETLCKWWNDNSFGRNVFIGMALYKFNRNSPVPAWKSPRQLPGQLRITRKYPNISGVVFFSSSNFNRDLLGFQDSLSKKLYRHPALTPPCEWLSIDKPSAPENINVSRRKMEWNPPVPASAVALPMRYIVYLNAPGEPFDSETSIKSFNTRIKPKPNLKKKEEGNALMKRESLLWTG